ncbi:MAG: 1-phosphofructokinase family hexose kinase [Malacoplasma sp.]|nr:1-phosphofructokinase family hexose kinase [Malacoplasma sp.]
MIYTITFAPSIDYVINTDNQFNNDGLNRVADYDLFPGGKGINASVILKRIGFENKAITFLGGSTKKLFLDLLKNENLQVINIDVDIDTRINVKMFAKNNSFEINGKKPIINQNEFFQLISLIDQFNSEDIVFIMGICDEIILEKIIEKLHNKNIKFILDIDSKKMLTYIKYKPFLIKPNLQELQSFLNQKIESEIQLKQALYFLKNSGCKNVLVSNGEHGSYLISDENILYKIEIQKINNIVSTVGAGDTLISSFAMFYLQTKKVVESLFKATSLSIGTVLSKWLANKTDLNLHLDYIKVSKIN